MRRGVVIGNVRDPNFGGRKTVQSFDDIDLEALRRARARLYAQDVYTQDVLNAQTGQLEDESGLTIHHEVDPALKAQLAQLGQTAKTRGIWIAGALGVLLGLLLAGMTWWLAQQVLRGGGGSRR